MILNRIGDFGLVIGILIIFVEYKAVDYATVFAITPVFTHKVYNFLSLDLDEVGAIKYEIKPVNKDAEIIFQPYLDSGITNEDTNWEEQFWETLEIKNQDNQAYIVSRTLKTKFTVSTYMHNAVLVNSTNSNIKPVEVKKDSKKIVNPFF